VEAEAAVAMEGKVQESGFSMAGQLGSEYLPGV